MSETVVRVENLGKKFQLGKGPRQDLLSERISGAASRFFDAISRRSSGNAAKDDESFWALKGVSFDIRRGDTVGVIGRNGAGKSTLLKVLSRITEPTEGFAEITGRIGALLEVGTGFHPELSGRENIYLNGAILGMSRLEIQRKFDEIVAFADVERYIDTPVKHYSSGMGLRLGFAVAAHLELEILVVDEVLAVGDLAFQQKCLGKMQDVSSSGRTVFFVSHNMSAITKLCSRAMLLEKGQIVHQGGAKEVVAKYLSGALGTSGSAQWQDDAQSPGIGGFKLRGVQLLDADGKPMTVVDIRQPVRLAIDYSTTEPNLKFRCVANFHTAGVFAFASMEQHEIVRERPGDYQSTVTIPGNLLAEGEYLVSFSAFASRGRKAHLCMVKNVIAFQVYDPVEGESARGDFGEPYGGVMRPLLPWTLERP